LRERQTIGVTVALDLDRFKEITRSMGWTEYSPNIITGTLTALIEKLALRHRGVVVHGLDEERGTEEAIVKFVDVDLDELLEDLESIRREVEELGRRTSPNATISIGVYVGPITSLKPKPLAKAKKDPEVVMALRALRKAKKVGGNTIILL